MLLHKLGFNGGGQHPEIAHQRDESSCEILKTAQVYLAARTYMVLCFCTPLLPHRILAILCFDIGFT